MQKPGPDGAAGTARPLSVAPAQWEGVDVSRQAKEEKAPRGRRATTALPKMSVGGLLKRKRYWKVRGRVFVSGEIFQKR